MTKTLTEQWREGTLPDGFYYMQDYTGRYCYRYLLGVKPDADFVKCFKGVLAPVPSYEEWKETKEELELYRRAIEQTDRVEKCLNQEGQIIRLEEQLRIATKALEYYDGLENIIIDWKLLTGQETGTARKALKEMKGVK